MQFLPIPDKKFLYGVQFYAKPTEEVITVYVLILSIILFYYVDLYNSLFYLDWWLLLSTLFIINHTWLHSLSLLHTQWLFDVLKIE